LNKDKTQTFRIFLLDADQKTVESKDITITKNYIKEENVDLSKVNFT
jgi:hypothetical protein